jgi:transcriptional regulator with XRE-family HTH domain
MLDATPFPRPAADGRLAPQTARAATPVDAHVAGAIRARRKAANMSQEALAQRLGLTFQQIQKYESARNRVSAGRLAAIAHVFGTSPAAFFPADEGAGGHRRAAQLADLNGALGVVASLIGHRRDEIADLKQIRTTLQMTALQVGHETPHPEEAALAAVSKDG